jgi:hypothetical protein
MSKRNRDRKSKRPGQKSGICVYCGASGDLTADHIRLGICSPHRLPTPLPFQVVQKEREQIPETFRSRKRIAFGVSLITSCVMVAWLNTLLVPQVFGEGNPERIESYRSSILRIRARIADLDANGDGPVHASRSDSRKPRRCRAGSPDDSETSSYPVRGSEWTKYKSRTVRFTTGQASTKAERGASISLKIASFLSIADRNRCGIV